MGVQLRFGTAGATGGGWSAQPGSLQPAYAEFWAEPAWRYTWQARAPKTWRDPVMWESQWSWGCRVGGGADLSYSAQGIEVGNGYAPFSCDGPGNQSLKFLKGMVVDESDNPIPSATVQAFRTSDDAFAGYEVSVRADGSYDLATNFPGVNHYVVGYDPGSPDRGGTTLNTLVPTNIDGS